jgi:hypothetical protein
MIRSFWFEPDVTTAMRDYDETLSICMNSVTSYMQKVHPVSDLGRDLTKFDATVCRITCEAIVMTNPHLKSIIAVAVNRSGNRDLGDVEVRFNHAFHNLVLTTPGLFQLH